MALVNECLAIRQKKLFIIETCVGLQLIKEALRLIISVVEYLTNRRALPAHLFEVVGFTAHISLIYILSHRF